MPAVVALAAVLCVPACSADGAARCEEAFTTVATAVDGVATAEWDCSENFGGGWQRGHVVIEASTEAEAVEVMEALLRAFAAAPDLEDGWATPQEYATGDRSIVVGANDAGFNGPPTVGQVREHYGIAPR